VKAPGWPVSLRAGPVGVRPLRLRDAPTWVEVRLRNEAWLAPWEGRAPEQPPLTWAERHTVGSFSAMLRVQRREARAGRALPFAVTYDGDLVGQVNVGSIVRGAYHGGYVGYWIDERVAGLGVTPTALALVLDHCFGAVGLHRVEANVRPENAASLRVVAKLGFRAEGLRRRYLFIDGDWRDHRCFALLPEDVSEGVLRRLNAAAEAGPAG
jgi:ribosomal-protein-alanine N-acetyltransferase